MSSFDFSIYDSSDKFIPLEEGKKNKLSDFDFELYEPPIKKERSYLDVVKDYGKTALKGTVEGISRLGQAMGPLKDISRTGAKTSEQELEQQTETLNKLLPTEEEGFGQKALRRGLKIAPNAIATPFGGAVQSAVRSGIAGGLGQVAEELGGGELTQTLAELAAFTSPSFTKKLIEKGQYKSLIQAAKRFKMSDEEIAPLIQSEFKQKWFSKIAKKTGKTEESLSKTKAALDRSYEGLLKSPNAQKVLDQNQSNELLSNFSKIAEDLPSEVRNRISADMMDLVKKPISGQSLMNLWKDINYYVGKGERQLGLFKEPIRKAFGNISPDLEKDFTLVNNMYKKYYPIVKNLKPNNVDKFIDVAETLGMVGSVFSWNFPAMLTFMGEKSARILSREMLINPRFQQLTKKMIIAIQENRLPMIEKITKQMNDLISPFLVDESKQEKEQNSNR